MEQASSQRNPNPFLVQYSSQPITLRQANVNCPPENRFQAWHEASQDTQPNTNSFLGVVKEGKSNEHSLKISTMFSVTREIIDRFINETKCVRYVDNPQLVEGLILRYIPHIERAQINSLAAKIDLRREFYLVIMNGRLRLDWEYMSMYNLHKFLENLKTVTSHTSDKSDEARAYKAGMQTLQLYLEQEHHSSLNIR